MKIEDAVKKETTYISICSLIFSVLLQAVFFLFSKWDVSVILGNILGLFAALLNFFLMALTVQEAVKRKDEKEMKIYIKRSQMLRNLMLIVLAGTGAALNWFNTVAVLVPLFFPRIAIFMRPLFIKDGNSKD